MEVARTSDVHVMTVSLGRPLVVRKVRVLAPYLALANAAHMRCTQDTQGTQTTLSSFLISNSQAAHKEASPHQ